jgi:peroxiredoxin
VVANDSPDKLAALRQDQGLEYPVLIDPGAGTIRAYGVLNEGHGSIAHPTALLIDTESVVRFVRVDEDYKIRPLPAELSAALRALRATAP